MTTRQLVILSALLTMIVMCALMAVAQYRNGFG